jgi:hypothetical protein
MGHNFLMSLFNHCSIYTIYTHYHLLYDGFLLKLLMMMIDFDFFFFDQCRSIMIMVFVLPTPSH